jgi:hypothetical protein
MTPRESSSTSSSQLGGVPDSLPHLPISNEPERVKSKEGKYYWKVDPVESIHASIEIARNAIKVPAEQRDGKLTGIRTRRLNSVGKGCDRKLPKYGLQQLRLFTK